MMRPGVPAPSLAPRMGSEVVREAAYHGRVYLTGAYKRRTEALLERLGERHGFSNAWTGKPETAQARQLSLWPSAEQSLRG